MGFITKRIIIAAVIIICAVCYGVFSTPSGIPVLNYHQINDRDENALTIAPEQFAAQMDWLKEKGYHTLTQAEFLDAMENGKSLPEKSILITFDDGYLDNYKHAYGILKERDMKATIFIISDFVGLYPNYLKWNQILEMQENGIEFGSHTLNHTPLTQCASMGEVNNQLTQSKAALEWRLGREMKLLAYPCGFQTQEIQDATKAAGYHAAFTVSLGYDHVGDNMYELHRVPIFGANDHTLLRFKARLTVPRLAAALENFQNDLAKDGHVTLANLVPVI